MKKSALLQVLVVALVVVTSSQAMAQNKKGRAIGAFIGGGLGILLGDTTGERIAGAAGGALLGGLIGGEIQEQMSEHDQQECGNAMNRALRSEYTETPYTWRGTSYYGNIYFTRQEHLQIGYCREYRSETFSPHGHTVQVGYICQYNDGRWYPQSRNPWGSRVHDNARARQRTRYSPSPWEIRQAEEFCARVARSQAGFEACVRDQLGGY